MSRAESFFLRDMDENREAFNLGLEDLGISPTLATAFVEGLSGFLKGETALCVTRLANDQVAVEIPLDRESKTNPNKVTLTVHRGGVITLNGEGLYIHGVSLTGSRREEQYEDPGLGSDTFVLKTPNGEIALVKEKDSGRVTISVAI